MGRCAVKRTLLWSATVSLFCLLYFIPYKVRADNGADLLNKCASLKSQNTNKPGTNLEQARTNSRLAEKEKSLRTLKKTKNLVGVIV